jgi:hypothetical protein
MQPHQPTFRSPTPSPPSPHPYYFSSGLFTDKSATPSPFVSIQAIQDVEDSGRFHVYVHIRFVLRRLQRMRAAIRRLATPTKAICISGRVERFFTLFPHHGWLSPALCATFCYAAGVRIINIGISLAS